MATIEGTLKIQFDVDGEVSEEQLKDMNDRLKIIVEATSSEVEEIIDIVDLKLDSVNPVIIEENLTITED